MVRKTGKVPVMTNVQKLKKLQVYRKFVRNLKASFKEFGWPELNNVDTYINSKNTEELMWAQFIWLNTPEGHDFWERINEEFLAI